MASSMPKVTRSDRTRLIARDGHSLQYRVGLICFASGRVLVVHGGVFGCSSRMNGKPSSPVLRGLGASNGARPLDSNPGTRASWTHNSTCALLSHFPVGDHQTMVTDVASGRSHPRGTHLAKM